MIKAIKFILSLCLFPIVLLLLPILKLFGFKLLKGADVDAEQLMQIIEHEKTPTSMRQGARVSLKELYNEGELSEDKKGEIRERHSYLKL